MRLYNNKPCEKFVTDLDKLNSPDWAVHKTRFNKYDPCTNCGFILEEHSKND